MALESSANLLFNIGADASDAESTVKRFRTLMSNELGGIKDGFDAWSKGMLRSLSNMRGAAGGAAGAAAAAIVGLASAFVAATRKTAEFADEIENGMDKTGLGAVQMSRLRFAAEQMDVQYGTLVGSLVKFQRAIVEADKGTGEQAAAFRRLGISVHDVHEGTGNLMPLLLRTSDAFKSQSSMVEKAAIAQQLFGRAGAEMLPFLGLGSEGLKHFGDEAERVGRVISDETVQAAKEYRIAARALKAELDGLWFSIGKHGIPILTKITAAMIGFIEAAKRDEKGFATPWKWWVVWMEEAEKAQKRLTETLAIATAAAGDERLLPPTTKEQESATKKTMQDFTSLTELLQDLRFRLREMASEEERIAVESLRMEGAVEKAAAKLRELHGEGKITGEVFKREMAALSELPAAIGAIAEQKMRDLETDRARAIVEATRDLESRLAGLEDQTIERRRATMTREIALLRERLESEGKLTERNVELLEEIEKAGLNRLDRERTATFTRELERLQSHLAQMVQMRMTSAERIRFTYELDRERFGEVEQAKSLALAEGEAEREAIVAQFAINRRAAFDAYLADLNALRNSEGWRGVFGEAFGSSIRGNEELLRQWAESANQSLLMVQVAMESTGDAMRNAFRGFAQAMAASIAQAAVYRQSIGEAMRDAVASTLRALAAESFVHAIYATALGFLRLAQWDKAGATAAFQAAALFGSVGAAAAVSGRAIAPRQAGAGASGASSQVVSGAAAGSSAPGGSGGRGTVSIYVNGPIIGQSGIEELTELINEAVQDRDVRLVATQVKQETRALR